MVGLALTIALIISTRFDAMLIAVIPAILLTPEPLITALWLVLLFASYGLFAPRHLTCVVVLLLSAIAYFLLQSAIIREHGAESLLRTALGHDLKGKLSPALYLAAIVLSFWWPWPAVGIYVLVALIWLVPDRRISRVVK